LDAQIKAETAAKDTTEEKVHELNSKIAEINGKLSPCQEKMKDIKQEHEQAVDTHKKNLQKIKKKEDDTKGATEKATEDAAKLEAELATMKGDIDAQTKKHSANQSKISQLEKELEDCKNKANDGGGDDFSICATTLMAMIVERRSFMFTSCDMKMTPDNEKEAKDTIKEVISLFKPLRTLDTKLKLFTHGWRGGTGVNDDDKIPCLAEFHKKNGFILSQGRANKIAELLDAEAKGESVESFA